MHVYFGGPGGVRRAPSQALDAPDGASGFGCRLAAAGDLDGDGYADLAMARVGDDFSRRALHLQRRPQRACR